MRFVGCPVAVISVKMLATRRSQSDSRMLQVLDWPELKAGEEEGAEASPIL